jgi:hypothetical protein
MRAILIVVLVAALGGCAQTRDVQRPSAGDHVAVNLEGCEELEATPQESSLLGKSRLGRLWSKVHPATTKPEEQQVVYRRSGQPEVRTESTVSSEFAPSLRAGHGAPG